MKIFTVYDGVAENYSPLVGFRTAGEAMRDIAEEANRKGTKMSDHAADLHLFEVGEFSQVSGSLVPLPAKINHGTLLEIRAKLNSSNVTKLQEGVA